MVPYIYEGYTSRNLPTLSFMFSYEHVLTFLHIKLQDSWDYDIYIHIQFLA